MVAVLACLAVPSAASADSRGLAARWSLNEGAGQFVKDRSGNRNNGYLGSTTKADSNDPVWIPGFHKNSSALRFGGDDFVTVEDSTTLEPSELTVKARVRATGSPGSYRYIVSKGAIHCLAASYGLYTGRDGGLAFYVSNGSEFTLSPDAGATVWDGGWHRVVGTFDGSVVRLYVDRVEVGSGSPTSVSLVYGLPTNDRLYIGDYRGDCANPLGFVGDVDAVAIFRHAWRPGGG